MKIAIIGGGAAGFFSALAAKELDPETEVLLLERSAKLLSKVRISGGGRCNVTHACFEPQFLVKHYPRGYKELLGPFHRFQPRDTMEWFNVRGITLKQETDGRMFPVSDCSDTIIDCFLGEAQRLGVNIRTQTKLHAIRKVEKGFELDTGMQPPLFVHRVILATGSSRSGWEFAKSLGHTIQTPVPSLFAFNILSFPLVKLAGVSVNRAKLKLEGSRFEQTGPLLITHWGFSGPAALKLSAFGARFLAERKYVGSLYVDWLPEFSETELRQLLETELLAHPAQYLGNLRVPSLSKNLWRELCNRSGLSSRSPSSLLSKNAILRLCETLKSDHYEICGKTTNKEEFVTCGGITLSEVQSKTMESKYCKGLFFCGEILDIDGVTGGFNFQNAWTTGWIAGRAAVI
ncbi:MAG: NAD(P)/FAD-dependent oxidoreductase [Waddliaceae bacterium]